MAIPVVPSATDVSVTIRIIDSGDGTPETGVTSATSGIDLRYRKGATGAWTALTEANLSALTDAHSDGGILHIGGGYYRVDLPDAAVPTAENETTLVAGTITDMIVLGAALVGRTTPASVANVAAVETDTQDIQGRIPAALVSGRIDASVGAMAAGTVTAAAVATDAIDADALASDAVTELQAGLSAPTAAANAAAVWSYLTSSITTAGSIGVYLLGRLSSAAFTIVNRAIGAGTLELVQGDDYAAADSTSVSWTLTNANAYDLDGAAGALYLVNNAAETITIVAAFAQSGTTVTVTLADIAAATSAAWAAGTDWRGQLKATVGSSLVTVQTMTVEIVGDTA